MIKTGVILVTSLFFMKMTGFTQTWFLVDKDV